MKNNYLWKNKRFRSLCFLHSLPDNSNINWLLFSLILAAVSVLGFECVCVFSKYNYVTLKHLEYLVDLFSLGVYRKRAADGSPALLIGG